MGILPGNDFHFLCRHRCIAGFVATRRLSTSTEEIGYCQGAESMYDRMATALGDHTFH